MATVGNIEIKVTPDLSEFKGEALDELARIFAARLAEWQMFEDGSEFAAWYRQHKS